MTREQAIRKIRGLLALAEEGRGATAEEATEAAGKAARLMSAFGVEAATVESGGEGADRARPIVKGDAPLETMSARGDTWKNILSGGVDAATRCKSYWRRVTIPADPAAGTPGRDGLILCFVGTEPDVAAAGYLLASVFRQVDRLAALYSGRGRAWLNSYRLGLAVTIARRMRDSARTTEQATAAAAQRGELPAVTCHCACPHRPREGRSRAGVPRCNEGVQEDRRRQHVGPLGLRPGQGGRRQGRHRWRRRARPGGPACRQRLGEARVMKPGDVVTIGPPYIGGGCYGSDASTGQTMRLVRRSGPLLAGVDWYLAPLGLPDSEWTVSVSETRLTLVTS